MITAITWNKLFWSCDNLIDTFCIACAILCDISVTIILLALVKPCF